MCHWRRRFFWQKGLEQYAWFGTLGSRVKWSPQWAQRSLVTDVLQSIEGLENIALRGESGNCVHPSFCLWSCKSDF